MRSLFAGCFVAVGLFCGVTLAQNVQREGQGTQPAQPGQQTLQPGQARPGQAGQALQQTQPGQQFAQRQGGQPGQTASSDQQIAACVFCACRSEIEIAKLAEQKSQTPEIRDFAQKMVKEHTPGCQEMQRLAGPLASDNLQQPGGDSAGRGLGGQLDWVSIHKQIGQQCLASVKQELSQKSSADFDECFIGQQIGAHLMVIDELKVLRNYASQELQPTLDKELQTAQQHLQLAKQIALKIKDRPSERVSRRPDSDK
jgi:predicted outer membrane protein